MAWKRAIGVFSPLQCGLAPSGHARAQTRPSVLTSRGIARDGVGALGHACGGIWKWPGIGLADWAAQGRSGPPQRSRRPAAPRRAGPIGREAPHRPVSADTSTVRHGCLGVSESPPGMYVHDIGRRTECTSYTTTTRHLAIPTRAEGFTGPYPPAETSNVTRVRLGGKRRHGHPRPPTELSRPPEPKAHITPWPPGTSPHPTRGSAKRAPAAWLGPGGPATRAGGAQLHDYDRGQPRARASRPGPARRQHQQYTGPCPQPCRPAERTPAERGWPEGRQPTARCRDDQSTRRPPQRDKTAQSMITHDCSQVPGAAGDRRPRHGRADAVGKRLPVFSRRQARPQTPLGATGRPTKL